MATLLACSLSPADIPTPTTATTSIDIELPPHGVFFSPPGMYAISMEFNTNPIDDALAVPNSPNRQPVHTFLRKRGYHQTYPTLYLKYFTTALIAWLDLLDLRKIDPLGTTLRSIALYHIVPTVIKMPVSDLFGGTLMGPTPIGLVPPNVPHVQMTEPPNPLPVGVRRTAAALHGPNWAMPA